MYLCLILMILASVPLLGQESMQNFLLEMPPNEVETYQIDPGFEGYFKIHMPFEDSKALNFQELALLKAKEIIAVDLVYTLFPENKDFTELNTQRLEALSKIFPTLFAKKNIQWRAIGQSACKSRTEAQKLFHGFVLYYRSFTPMQKLKLSGELPIDQYNIDEDPDFIDAPSLHRLLQNNYLPEDSTVYKVLERNQAQWNNSLAVIDWTGSMYPYGFQLLVWMKLHLKDSTRFTGMVFFNDGDHKLPGEKTIGSTEGIYSSPSKNLQDIIGTMAKVQHGGNGGYDEENDLEALIRAQELYPESENIILIADGRSFVRDMVLLDYFAKKCLEKKQKLRIILCGIEENLAPDYLYIAAKTGGSLHTLYQDIEALYLNEEGQFINQEGQSYYFYNGLLELRFQGRKKRYKSSAHE
ncbi:MAG: vWA domain-containing protein [Microscillaceae bacterium]|nr:vWA domain-containing protein [Microscillaceae bacterium]